MGAAVDNDGKTADCGLVNVVATEPTIRVLLATRRLLQEAKDRRKPIRAPSMVADLRLQSKLRRYDTSHAEKVIPVAKKSMVGGILARLQRLGLRSTDLDARGRPREKKLFFCSSVGFTISCCVLETFWCSVVPCALAPRLKM